LKRGSCSRSERSSERFRSSYYKNIQESNYDDIMYDDVGVVKYECKLCVIEANSQVSLDSHLRGKGHLQKEFLVQERRKVNTREDWKTNDWEKARPSNSVEREEYLELKKNMKILQTMYQEKLGELNHYKTMYEELQSQLKDLTRYEEKRNRTEEEDFDMRNRLVFKKEVKREVEETEYAELETNQEFDMKNRLVFKKEVKRENEDIEYVELVVTEEFDLRERLGFKEEVIKKGRG